MVAGATDINMESHNCVRATAHGMNLGSSTCLDITMNLGCKQVICINLFLTSLASKELSLSPGREGAAFLAPNSPRYTRSA